MKLSIQCLLLCLGLSACVVVVPVPQASTTTVATTDSATPGRPTAVTRTRGQAALTAWPASADCRRPAEAATLEATVLAEINALRADNGVPSLRPSARLRSVAQKHACDNAAHGVFAHVGSDGATLDQRLGREGYRARRAAENTGLGFGNDPARVMALWKSSPAHRANLLDGQMREMALGYAPAGKPAWVLLFARPF